MLKKWLIFILVVMCMPMAYAYNQIWEFDANEEVYITTTVYVDGVPCTDCDCNLTIYNPYPNQSTLNISVMMDNDGNGIYSYNLSYNLSYNKNIYPVILYCNKTTFYAGDSRVGIKIGESMFDYTALMLAMVAIGGFLLFSSFKVNPKFWELQVFTYGASFAFFIIATRLGIEIAKLSPNSTPFIQILDISFWAILIIFLIIVYLRAKDIIVSNIRSVQIKDIRK